MIRRLLSWLFGLPTLVILLLFALANRHVVTLSLDPLTPEQPWLALQLPLWMIVFGGVLLGMLVGGMAAWARQGKWRRLARQRQHELELERVSRQRLERQLQELIKADEAAVGNASPATGSAVSAPRPATGTTPALPASTATTAGPGSSAPRAAISGPGG